LRFMVRGRVAMVPLEDRMEEAYLTALRGALSALVHERGLRGVILDFSTVTFMDGLAAGIIRDTAYELSVLGAVVVPCGIGPGLAACLVDLGCTFPGLQTAMDREGALSLLAMSARRWSGLPADDEPGNA